MLFALIVMLDLTPGDHLPPVIAKAKKLIVSTRCIRMVAPAIITITVIFIIPLNVELRGAHSPDSLAATTIAIEDERPPCWQCYRTVVAAIVTTAILDLCVATIATIGQNTRSLIPVSTIFIIPIDASIPESTWTTTFLCDAIGSSWPLIA